MSKFTEGKWEVEIIYGDHCAVFANEYLVADCFSNEANARLIAAAPEMYELLKEELISTSDYGGIISFERERKIKELLARIDGEGRHE